MNDSVLWTLIAIFIVLWLGGVVTSHLFGGLIHILLVVAVIAIVVRLVKSV